MKLSIPTLILALSLSSLAQASDDGAADLIDINKASAEQSAQALDGIGLSKARAIVEYRRVNGAFGSLESLEAIKGIGASTIANNKNRIRISK